MNEREELIAAVHMLLAALLSLLGALLALAAACGALAWLLTPRGAHPVWSVLLWMWLLGAAVAGVGIWAGRVIDRRRK